MATRKSVPVKVIMIFLIGLQAEAPAPSTTEQSGFGDFMEPTEGALGRRSTTIPRRSSVFRAISVKKIQLMVPAVFVHWRGARAGARGQPSHSVMILDFWRSKSVTNQTFLQVPHQLGELGEFG